MFYTVDTLVCLKLTFETSKKIKCFEYIHGIILEHINVIGGEPRKIKIKQIGHLKDFMNAPNDYEDFKERVLDVQDIEIIINYET